MSSFFTKITSFLFGFSQNAFEKEVFASSHTLSSVIVEIYSTLYEFSQDNVLLKIDFHLFHNFLVKSEYNFNHFKTVFNSLEFNFSIFSIIFLFH
jgi:hypothetical protein